MTRTVGEQTFQRCDVITMTSQSRDIIGDVTNRLPLATFL